MRKLINLTRINLRKEKEEGVKRIKITLNGDNLSIKMSLRILDRLL